MYSQLTTASQTTLKKVADSRLAAIKALLGKRLINDSDRLLDYGLPVLTGAGATGVALANDRPLGESLAIGGGVGFFTSPKGWKSTWNAAKASEDPITTFGTRAAKQLVMKAAPLATYAAVTQVPPILNNARSITDNLATGTGAFAETAPQIAKDVANTTGAISTNAPNLMSNLNNTVGGMSSFWDPQTGTAKVLTDAAVSANKNISGLAESVGRNLENISRGVEEAGAGTKDVGNAAKRLSNSFGALGDKLNDGLTWVGENRGKALAALLGGTAALGGGGLLLHKLLSKKKKEEK